MIVWDIRNVACFLLPFVGCFVSMVINESIYPSTYIFGGPDKILLQVGLNISNTESRHFYLDCRCEDNSQVLDAFGFLDRVAREFTYHIRYILFFQILYFIVFSYFDAYISKYIFTVEIFSFWIIFASVFIISIQDTSCKQEFECENSVWARSMWGWFLLILQCLYIFYLEYIWNEDGLKRFKRNLKGFKLLV